MVMVYVLACLVLVSSCAHKVDEIRLVPQQHRYSMMIACDSSKFKDSVREKIIEKYRNSCAIHVVNIKALSKEDTAPYDVVLIMDTCMAWSGFNPSLKTYLSDWNKRDKTVLSMTAGNPDWTFSYNGVDAITSASVVENQDLFFSKIDDEIQRILNEKSH